MPTSKQRAQRQHALEDIGIYRRTDAARGAHVHVTLTRSGKTFQKYFVDAKCGGQTEALRLARAWRDRVVHESPALALADFCAIVRSNNKSGVAGVSRVVKGHRSSQGLFVSRPYWRARLPVGQGKFLVKCFSVRELGEEGARASAIKARLDALRALGKLAFKADKAPKLVSKPEDFTDLNVLLQAPKKRQLLLEQQKQERRQKLCEQTAERRMRIRLKDEEALKTPTNMSGTPYIGRSTTSAQVGSWRVSMIHGGVRYRKTFSDAKFGGEDNAFLAAKTWRDLIFSAFKRERKNDAATRAYVRNTSGVTGVFKSRHVSKSKVWEYWVAKAPLIKGQPTKTKKFSVAKYGHASAYQLAVAARESFVALLEGELTNLHLAGRKLEHELAAQVDVRLSLPS